MHDPAKKSDKLEVRLPHATKQAFLQRCQAEGRSASGAVRGFIDAYLARPLTQKELPMYVRPTLALAAATAALVIGVVTLTATPSRAASALEIRFNDLDLNKDGKITPDEFAKMPAVKFPDGSPPLFFTGPTQPPGTVLASDQERLALGRTMTSDYDSDKDGRVSFKEFAASHYAALTNAFAEFDANKDGTISRAELGAPLPAVTVPGAKPQIRFRDPPEKLLARFDGDKDGVITEKEFLSR